MDDINRQHEAGAAAIWDWQSNQVVRIKTNVNALRIKGIIQASIAFIIAGTFSYFELTIMAYVAATFGVITLLSALFSPTRAYATMNRGAERLGLLLSTILKWIFIPTVYYTFFLPFGMLFRRGKRDTLKRMYASDSPSYWEKREATADMLGTRGNQF